ncbi:glucose PTS transporter subunit IIA [Mesoplasma tabanidae]|uniref:PTS system, beta-glucoside-specific IIABC component n=1 Tax=Mesoplasma tabanidae TaxID=219745 RepID=A0A2K8P4H7_9MOLU|nr:glucose PTS transporter subunit IIA [Mesoplasma tabanidae]ATZ21388.1 PTS system, beta-glucoside-specific IIABC component [Mesoplasma tabanidae]
MEFKIYAPVDGVIKEIDKCQDQMFADRMLGDGFVITPSKNKFYSFFDIGEVSMIFDTKHAYGFNVKGLSFLIHCGMDTVELQGEGFDTKLQVGDVIKKDDELFSVDLNLLNSKKISAETPIVFEFNSLKSYSIKNLKTGKIKQGEEICTLWYEDDKTAEPLPKSYDIVDFFNVSNKYEKAASEINKLVGGKNNYNDVYNCMTRLRFNIKEKELVNFEKIKQNELVKGVLWNGAELQIVIGQDVFKVKDEIVRINTSNEVIKNSIRVKKQESLIKRFLLMFGGIMVPVIPCIVGTGLVQALVAILTQSGIMPNIVLKDPVEGQSVLLSDAGIGWIILYIMGKTTTIFSGVIISVSAAKYFKYDPVVGAMLGIILCSPLLFGNGGELGIGNDFILIDLGKINTGNPMLDKITQIKINMMNAKIFVVIGAIFTAKHLDKWLKSFIPVTFDLVLRTFITILVVAPLAFFGYGIIWNFIEVLFGAIMLYIGQIPLGIGVGIFVAIWQVAVIFGVHLVLSLITFLDFMTNGGQSSFGMAGSISVWAQIGALIGVIIVTQNAKLKKHALGMIPAGILGITEPILYGINLPKKRPLISGVIAAFVAGALAANMGVTKRAITGFGIFEAIGYFSEPSLGANGDLAPVLNGMLYLLACLVSVSLGITLSVLSYKERPNEKTLLNKTFKKLINLISIENNFDSKDKKELSQKLKEVIAVLDSETIKEIKQNEKSIQKYLKQKEKLNTLVEKEAKLKASIISKGKRLVAKEEFEKAEHLIKKYNLIDNKDKFNKFNIKIDELYKEIDFDFLDNKLSRIQKTIMNNLKEVPTINKTLFSNLEPIVYNSLHSLMIYYGLSENKEVKINFAEMVAVKRQHIKAELKINN